MKKTSTRMQKNIILSIEEHLGWGSSDSWTHKDFNELSERILEVTGKQLSVTTLKRVFGRAETVASPSVTTFDILSEFLGFESWRHFQNANGKTKLKTDGKRAYLGASKFGLGVLALILLALIIWSQRKPPIEETTPVKNQFVTKNVLFELDKVATGYPNTVIFRYDYGDLDYDSICIQQSWDTRKQIPLKGSKGLVTSTYYQPGYFLAKLIADGQILEERNLYIPTTGWQGMVLGDGKRSYLKPEELRTEKGLTVAAQILHELEEIQDAGLYIANLSPEPNIDGNNFELTTSFRMSEAKENSICENIRMIITGTREVISLAFSKPGCVGDLYFFLDKDMVSGKNHDFSGFGRELDTWTHCQVKVDNGLLKVLVEGQEVFSKELDVDLGKIGGVQWYFEGLGEINELFLKDQEQQLDLL